MNQPPARRIDLDVLRVFACYLLIPFHVAMVFNPAPFYHVRNDELSSVLMIACGFVSLWHMPLLFLLAGWSAFASYRSRGAGAFARERVRRLVCRS
ncbi:MAG: acyltransferase family protein [Deltaproteobacteria bacterium]|nr:acyltransferase family protein [Deltaproteobacteria bacterium]